MCKICKTIAIAIAIAILSAGVLGFPVSGAQAATLVVPGSSDDYEAQKRSNNGVFAASENFTTASRVGHGTNFNGSGDFAPGGFTSLFFFQLPVLPSGQTVTSATFSVGRLPDSATSAVTPTFNADLYALGVIDTNPKTVEDAEKFWYIGNTPQAALPVVAGSTSVSGTVSRIADDFLVPADFIANGGSASATPDTADISSYIQDLYANPLANGFTPGTSFLVTRVNPDADSPPTSGTQRYFLAFSGAGTPENQPQITLETIPEPSSLAVALVAAVALLGYRRRG